MVPHILPAACRVTTALLAAVLLEDSGCVCTGSAYPPLFFVAFFFGRPAAGLSCPCSFWVFWRTVSACFFTHTVSGPSPLAPPLIRVGSFKLPRKSVSTVRAFQPPVAAPRADPPR